MPRTGNGISGSKLTERERRFVAAYVGEGNGNGAKAAQLAGYGRRSARVTASRLLTKANVQQAIAAHAAAATRESIASAQERDEALSRIVRTGSDADVIRAAAEMNRCAGRHLQRHEATIAVMPDVVGARERIRQKLAQLGYRHAQENEAAKKADGQR